MILSDYEIKELALSGMINPFEDKQKRDGVISFGLSSHGYDMRISKKFKIFTNVHNAIVDPKKFDDNAFIDFEGDICIIPPNSFVLGTSIEYFDIPRDIMCVVVGKSTIARCGLIVNVTPIEAGYCGEITIEISNTTPLPTKIYANEGIAQILFFKGKPCDISYKDKNGKYQGQKGIVLPRI